MKTALLGLAALTLLASAPPALAADDEHSTAHFVDLCSKPEHKDACADALAEYELDAMAPCPAPLDAVLAELKRHPEWGQLEWTDGVANALKTVCQK